MNSSKTTCSVAIAVYNGEKFIEQQLMSILNQTRPVDEVIICDDGSNDKTIEIINNIITTNNLTKWHLHRNSKNLGAGENFNTAIKKCSGDIIFFCDQDDVWHKNKVEEIINVFDTNSDVKSVVTNFKLIDENNNYLFNDNKLDNPWFHCEDYQPEAHNPLLYKVPLSTILIQCVSPGCTQAMRKELVDSLLSFNYDPMYHDLKVQLISGLYDGLYYLNKPLTKYRIHSKNTVGIPKCLARRRNKQFIFIPLYYINYFKNGIVFLLKKDARVQLMFNNEKIIEQLEKFEIKEHLLTDYNEWKKYAISRDKLYSKEKNKYKYWKTQKDYWKPNKNYTTMKYKHCYADPIENYERKVLDFVAMFKH